MNERSKPQIPGWFVGLTMIVAAAITVFAMVRRNAIEGWPATPGDLPGRVTGVLSPALAAVNAGSGGELRQVAARSTGPTVIRAGSSLPHADRGPCTVCHVVVDRLGAAIPLIRAMTSLPHPYRGGVCGNCHQLTTTPPAAATRPVAGTPPLGLTRPSGAGVSPSEGSWQGLEVIPITALTARQYGIPAGIDGVVVAEAEGVAAAAGLLAGDVVLSLNGAPLGDIGSFIRATGNGALSGGTMDVLRGGKLLRFTLGQSVSATNQTGLQPVEGGSPAAALWPTGTPREAPGQTETPLGAGGGGPPISPYGAEPAAQWPAGAARGGGSQAAAPILGPAAPGQAFQPYCPRAGAAPGAATGPRQF